MHLKTFLGLFTASQIISSAWSYGTIVEVYPSTCPALPSGPAILPVQYLLTVTPAPVNISPRAIALTYVTANGSTTTDCSAAAPFLLSNGQLSSNGHLISATGLVPYSPLVASSYTAAISTTFSVMNGSTLAWNNTAFIGGHAIFCVMETAVEAVYNGQLPAGCARVFIGYVPSSLCPTFKPSSSILQPSGTGTSSPSATTSVLGSINGRNVTASPMGCLNSPGTSPAIVPTINPLPIKTLEQCADFCSTYAYFGVQISLCVCGNTLASSATPATYGSCNNPCKGNSAESCGGQNAMVVYSIVSRSGPSSTMTGMYTTTGTGSAGQVNSSATATTSSMTAYATSTGLPNCFDRSPFDRTINGGYLILCNTALLGNDLMSANGTNLAECIAACNAQSTGPAGKVCVAVTFDITTSRDQCRLKNNIGVVDAGANDLSEAAIIVTGAYAPQIMFTTAASTMSSTAAPGTSTPSTALVSSSMTNTAPGTSTTASTPSTTSTSTSPAPFPTATSATGALCPGYNNQVVKIGGSFYQVECSTDTNGDTLTANTTTAASLAECGGFCNLYNLAIPFGCVGVTMLLTSASSNCYLKSRIIGTEFRAQDDSLRLIYPGYPTPTDPMSTATSTGVALSSSQATSSTGTSTFSSSSTGPTATGALCPGYNGQVLYFSSYGGSNYEIECSTNFADTGLSAIIATSLTDCINQCSFLNLNTETPQCVGVTFLNPPQTSPPGNNCFPKGSVNTIVRGVSQDDSARLIFQNYPSVTDMGTTGLSSTPTRTLISGTPSSSTTQSTTPATATASSTSTPVTSTTSTISTSSTLTSSGTSVPSPTGSLCPTYNFQIIQAGAQQYEIECGYELTGRDLGLPYSPYPNIRSFHQCIAACTYWNENTATLCLAANYYARINACYLKGSINNRIPSLTLNAARYIYSGYPSITDAGSASVTSTTTVTSSSASSATVSVSTPTSTGSVAPSASTSTSASTGSTSASSIISPTPSATASVYPADPVCPGNNGGQLTSQGSNLYNIECNVDLRYAPSDLSSTNVLHAATFSACALICDQNNLISGSSLCAGFTWDSTSTSSTSTNCYLKSTLIQISTTNTANTANVHSGRLLGPWPSTNRVILSRPIPLVTNTLYNGYSISYDFAALTVPGGLNWQITEFSSPTLYVGAMGFVALFTSDKNNQLGLTALSNANNNNTQPFTLPSGVLPTYAVAPYWTRGFASLSSQQGIYYQIDSVATGRFFISIEFFYARYTTNNDIQHWITTYDTGVPGVWTSWFFSSGTPDDRGGFETVGHQGTQSGLGIVADTVAAMYEHGQVGSVLSGDKIVSNTNPGTNTVARTQGAFDTVLFGMPGTWSYTNSPT